jgi:signal transduction histidine kinase
MCWVPKISHEQREALEEESSLFLSANYPDVVYRGVHELYFSPSIVGEYELVRSPNRSTYFPAHYLEPMEENVQFLDFNLNSPANPFLHDLEAAIETGKPTVATPFRTPQGLGWDSNHKMLMLFHPGIPLESQPNFVPTDVAALAIGTNMLMERLMSGITYNSVAVYLFDHRNPKEGEDVFLIGVDLTKRQSESGYYLPETRLHEVLSVTGRLMHHVQLEVASSKWHLVVVAQDEEFKANQTSVIVAGIFMFAACISVSFWIWWDSKRNRKIQIIQRRAEAEKAAVKLQSARDRARAEQELNDYIAHEIRNPLAAAMSACSFVKTAVQETPPLRGKEFEDSVREDVSIIDSSLTFMNDLLRSMLDMHKAESMKMDITLAPADLKRDILEPVAAMLYHRDSNFKVEIDCPENLILSTDKLRLKQIVLNLGRNSTKFVERGFIRLVATIVQQRIRIYIDDSGPGIPEEKRKNIFNKFQDSLDILEQGTGMGLCLCKNLAELLGCEIWLDEMYDSGLHGCPGTRFVIETNCSPMSIEECHESLLSTEIWDESKSSLEYGHGATARLGVGKDTESTKKMELPVTLSVLFVDDDMVLRKLFGRSVKKVIDTWEIHEAANGEAAIQMTKTQNFDVIFLDQYMSSAEKTLLGTETARALRSQGIKSLICGLSANDMERKFLAAGADFFLQKPFPCKPDELRRVLLTLVFSRGPNDNEGAPESEISSTTDPLGDEESDSL